MRNTEDTAVSAERPARPESFPPDAETPLISLRRYLPQDLDTLVRLDRLCFAPEFQFSRSDMRAFAEASGTATLIAEVGKRLAGFIIVAEEHPGSASRYVVTLDVVASYTRQGIGTTLLQAAEAIAATSRMTLHVHTANHSAVAFYERNGYRQAELLRNFYEIPGGGDAFLYEKDLLGDRASDDA